MLRSDLCSFSDAYIIVKGTIIVTEPDNVKRNKAVAFKNNAPFINCISKIHGDGKEGYDANKVGKNETEVVIPLKYLINFWRNLNIPLINCEVELILTWSKNYILADLTVRDAEGNDLAIIAPTGLEFKMIDTKLYVPVVNLSKGNDIKLLEQLKSGFKRTIKWNKYRSQMTMQPRNDNLNYLIDPTFMNFNRLFVLSFSRNNNPDNRDSFSDYYVPNVEIKDFMS